MFSYQLNIMGVTAFCITLLISVFILQRVHGHEGNAVLQIIPNQLQFFEYEKVIFVCKGIDGSSEWKVVSNSSERSPQCLTTNRTPPLECTSTISNTYTSDSGEYWCEGGAQRRSNSIVINITAGPVILESPALPVTEGQEVSLRCRTNSTSDFTTTFYKNGVVMSNNVTKHLIIPSVSKSDEGLYKCSIFGVGQSAQTWMTVTRSKVGGFVAPSSGNVTPWIVITVLLTLLLTVLGIRHVVKHYWHRVSLDLSTVAPGSDSAEETTEPSAAQLSAVVSDKNNRQKKEDDQPSAMYYTFDLKDEDEDAAPAGSTAVASQPSADTFYSLLQ